MTKKKIIIIGVIVTILLAVMASVLFFIREKKIADSLELNQEEIIGLPGDKIKLSLNVDRKAVWSTDNASIAKVSSNGMVKCIGEGKTTIEVKCMNRSLTCKVVVEDPKLNVETVYLVSGQEFPIRMENTTFEASAVTDNENIAYENGKVRAIAPGESGIMFQIKDKHFHCDVIVKDASMEKDLSLKKDASQPFRLENAPMDKKVEWKIKNTDIAEIQEIKQEDIPIQEDGTPKENVNPQDTSVNQEETTATPQGSTETTAAPDGTTTTQSTQSQTTTTEVVPQSVKAKPYLIAQAGQETMSDAAPASTQTQESVATTEATLPQEGTTTLTQPDPTTNTTDIDTVKQTDIGDTHQENTQETVSEETPELTQHNEIAVIHAKNTGVTEIMAKVGDTTYKAKIKVTGDQKLSIQGKYIALGTTKTISIQNFIPSYKVEWTNAKAGSKNGTATVFGEERGKITVKAVVDTGIEKKELSKEMEVIEKKLNMTSWSGQVQETFDLEMQDAKNPVYEFDQTILSREGNRFTALAVGKTTIHVKDGKTDLTCEVEVKEKKSNVETYLDNLKEISEYAKANPDKFSPGNPNPATWDEVLKADHATTKCTGHIKWACSMMGIKTNLWVNKGAFQGEQDLANYCEELEVPDDKNFQQVVEEGLLKPGDIICPDFTHIFTYTGNNYLVYDSGGSASKTNYENGFLVDYSSIKTYMNLKINSIYRWKE